MAIELKRYLEKLEESIDLEWEHKKLVEWKHVLAFEPIEGRFETGASAGKRVEPGEWPQVRVNEAIHDRERMLLQQLREPYRIACGRLYAVPNIRSNYGTGILPTLFGAEMFWMEDDLDTLPTARPLDGDDPIARLLDAGAPDLGAGLGARVFETAEYFQETLAPYPKAREAVWLYHPDLQGPIDVVELLWGSAMFLAFYEAPDRIRAVTELVTETYIRFLTKWLERFPPRDGGEHMAHWGKLFRGQVMLRDDSVVNLSPEMYAEFVKPYDERILAEFGGGGIHFCGKADHCIELMTDSENLTAVNMSQPHLNDVQKVYDATVGKGVVLNCGATDELLAFDLSRGVILG